MKLIRFLTRLQALDYLIWLKNRDLIPCDTNLRYFLIMEKIPFQD